MGKVLFRIWALQGDICSLLGDSIWKALARFSSPLVAQLVRDCMSRRHHISCEQEEFLAAPCVGLEWQKGLEQQLRLFRGACESFPTLCPWEVKGTFSKPFLSQIRKPGNKTHGTPQECLQGPHLKHQAISVSTKSPTLGAQGFVYTEEEAGTAFENCIIPEEHLGRQPFKGEFLHKVCFYSRTECTCRQWPFWCCWAALQQIISHSVNNRPFIILLVCKMVLRKVNECTES